MEPCELTRETKGVALEQGADLVGIVRVRDLAEHEGEISTILPTAERLYPHAKET